MSSSIFVPYKANTLLSVVQWYDWAVMNCSNDYDSVWGTAGESSRMRVQSPLITMVAKQSEVGHADYSGGQPRCRAWTSDQRPGIGPAIFGRIGETADGDKGLGSMSGRADFAVEEQLLELDRSARVRGHQFFVQPFEVGEQVGQEWAATRSPRSPCAAWFPRGSTGPGRSQRCRSHPRGGSDRPCGRRCW